MLVGRERDDAEVTKAGGGQARDGHELQRQCLVGVRAGLVGGDPDRGALMRCLLGFAVGVFSLIVVAGIIGTAIYVLVRAWQSMGIGF